MINSFLITSFFQWLSVVQFPFILQISLNLRFSFMIALNFFASGDCLLFWIFRLTKSSHHRKEFLRLYNHLKKTVVVFLGLYIWVFLGSYHFLVLSVTLFLHFPQQIVQFIPDHFLGMTLRNKILIGKTTRSRDFSTILKPIMVSAPWFLHQVLDIRRLVCQTCSPLDLMSIAYKCREEDWKKRFLKGTITGRLCGGQLLLRNWKMHLIHSLY